MNAEAEGPRTARQDMWPPLLRVRWPTRAPCRWAPQPTRTELAHAPDARHHSLLSPGPSAGTNRYLFSHAAGLGSSVSLRHAHADGAGEAIERGPGSGGGSGAIARRTRAHLSLGTQRLRGWRPP